MEPQASRNHVWKRIENFVLNHPGATRKQIIKHVAGGHKILKPVFQAMVDEGFLIGRGLGLCNYPRGFYLASMDIPDKQEYSPFHNRLLWLLKDNPGLKIKEIISQLKSSRATVHLTIKAALANGSIERQGEGFCGDPFRYYLTQPELVQTAPVQPALEPVEEQVPLLVKLLDMSIDRVEVEINTNSTLRQEFKTIQVQWADQEKQLVKEVKTLKEKLLSAENRIQVVLRQAADADERAKQFNNMLHPAMGSRSHAIMSRAQRILIGDNNKELYP